MKAVLFIALALLISPAPANAYLIPYPGFESSASYSALSNIRLLDELDQVKAGAFWPAGNIDDRLSFKNIWVSGGSLSSLNFTFESAGNASSHIGWTDPAIGFPFAIQTEASNIPGIDLVPFKKTPDPGPASIILFAPGLAGILVRRNWPYRLSLRTLGRSIFERIYHAPGFPIQGNLPSKILMETGFFAYFQFIHFKVRTIQLNQ
jgi:hypothetical protein